MTSSVLTSAAGALVVCASLVVVVYALVRLKDFVFYAAFRTLEFAVLYWLFTTLPRYINGARVWKLWEFVVQATTAAIDAATALPSQTEL
jgi:hypothetical protein